MPALSLLLGCAAVTGNGSSTSRYRGDELSTPVPLPAVTLTDTAGKPLNLQTAVKGDVAIVYFGYTNCPDVCPTTMADLGNAIRKLPSAEQQRVQVAFITTDPQHDTPARLRSWLDNFDAGLPHPFLGLGGSLATVQATAKKFGVVAENPQTDNGKVTDTHGAQVIAFSPPNEQAHLVWLPGTKVSDYTHDLHTLLTS
ncbi:MAG TPA: SCO family protein [Mycobacteriales bacterium]|nr:SCO family protein [Mycobacteriales bacterium]